MGNIPSPDWLATDTLLGMFAKQRKTARKKYADFVQQGNGIALWDNLTNQVFLGSDAFVQTHLTQMKEQAKDLSDVPKKQQRSIAPALAQYQQLHKTRNDAIKAAYQSGSYTLKALGDYFGLHYSRVSRIVAKSKT